MDHGGERTEIVRDEEDASTRIGPSPGTVPAGSILGPREARPSRYEVAGVLGKGGMGEVLLARDPDLRRTVALKRILPEDLSDAEAVARFVAEAQITAQLDHPNIVPVYELAADERGLYFTMKRVGGRTLEEVLERDRPPMAALLRIFAKVCEAIAFAHSRGVLHRDLKPANVMVGAYGEVLVVDWGLAKVFGGSDGDPGGAVTSDRSEEGAHQTLAEAVLGTPVYMAPEQAAGGIQDARTDVYALGGILYAILTGTAPHAVPGVWRVSEIFERISSRDVQSPGERAPDRSIPSELDAIATKALQRDPGRRYQEAVRLQADVEAYLEGRIVGAARYHPLHAAWKWARRRRAVLLPAAAVLLALGGAWVFGRWRAAREIGNALDEAAEAESAGDLETAKQAYERVLGLDRSNASAQEGNSRVVIAEARRRSDEAWATWLEAKDGAHAGSRAVVALAALESAGAWLGSAPDSPAARARRREAILALGEAALDEELWDMARFAFRRLEEVGESDLGARRAAEVEEHEQARLVEEVRTAWGDVAAGLSRPERESRSPGLAEWADRLAALRHPVVVRTLSGLLEPLARRIADLGGEVRITPEERDLLRLACHVLGRIGGDEVVDPLARLASLPLGSDLQVEVGRALCASGSARAYSPLLSLALALGTGTDAWHQVAEEVYRLPDPEASLEPRTADNHVVLGIIHRLRGDLPRALAAFDRALALEQGSALALAGRARVRTEMGDLEGAKADVTAALEIEPEAATLVERGSIRTALFDHAGAIEDYRAAIRLDPNQAAAYIGVAHWHRIHGRFDDAIANYDRALAIEPRDATALTDRAGAWYEKGEFNRAIADCDEALGIDPLSTRALSSRGRCLIELGRAGEALEFIQAAIDRDPRAAPLRCERGRFLLALGRAEEAREEFERSIPLAPDYVTARLLLAEALWSLGRSGEAIAACDQAMETLAARRVVRTFDAGAGDVHSLRGYYLFETGDLVRGMVDLDRAVELGPDVHALYHRGSARRQKGEVDGALEDLDRAVERAPRNAAIRCERALARIAAGDPAGALLDYDAAVELEPTSASHYHDRATARMMRFDWAGAEGDYGEALARDPGLGSAWRGRGFARRALGRHREAASDLARYLETAPEPPADAESIRAYVAQYGE